jgi:hypothetical protein
MDALSALMLDGPAGSSMRGLTVPTLSFLLVCGGISACGSSPDNSSAANLTEANLASDNSLAPDTAISPDNAAQENGSVDNRLDSDANNSAVARTNAPCGQVDSTSSSNAPSSPVYQSPTPGGSPSLQPSIPTVPSAPTPCVRQEIQAVAARPPLPRAAGHF